MPKGIYKRTKPAWNKGLSIDRKDYSTMGHFRKHTEERITIENRSLNILI